MHQYHPNTGRNSAVSALKSHDRSGQIGQSRMDMINHLGIEANNESGAVNTPTTAHNEAYLPPEIVATIAAMLSFFHRTEKTRDA